MKQLALVALVAVVFGGSAGYLGANINTDSVTRIARTGITSARHHRAPLVTRIAQTVGVTSVTSRKKNPDDPFIQYLLHLGREPGVSRHPPSENIVFGEYEQLYRLELIFAPVTRATTGSFGQYLLKQPTGLKDTHVRAREILGFVIDEGAGDDFSWSDQKALIRLGTQEQFGRSGSYHLSRRLNPDRAIFEQRLTMGTNEHGNFLDFLRNEYGLTFR